MIKGQHTQLISGFNPKELKIIQQSDRDMYT